MPSHDPALDEWADYDREADSARPKRRPPLLDASIAEIVEEKRPFLMKSFQAGMIVLLMVFLIAAYEGFSILHPLAWLIAGIACWANLIWIRGSTIGFPMVPIVCLVEFLWYGVPMLTYSEEDPTAAVDEMITGGLQVAGYLLVMTLIYRMLCTPEKTRRKPSFRVLSFLADRHEVAVFGMVRGVFALIIAYEVLKLGGMLWQVYRYLPSGVPRIFEAGTEFGALICVFVLAYGAGRKEMSGGKRNLSFGLIGLYWLVSAASLYLSTLVTSLTGVLLGLVLGSGKIPYRLMIVVMLGIVPLHTGKYHMRDQYWEGLGLRQPVMAWELPGWYAEWYWAGIGNLDFGVTDDTPMDVQEGQAFSDRLNNMGILTYVNARLDEGYEPLWGETYAAIPALLIPRFIWRGKPRAHLGQERLNIHFHRQTLEQTHTAYIAWGLLPEAIGNFGKVLGPLLLGLVSGLVYSLVTRFFALYPLKSVRTIVGMLFAVLAAGGTMMVASIWATRTFQLMILLAVATLPFWRVSTGRDWKQLLESEEW